MMRKTRVQSIRRFFSCIYIIIIVCHLYLYFSRYNGQFFIEKPLDQIPLTIIVEISVPDLLWAAKDTWLLDCPYNIVYVQCKNQPHMCYTPSASLSGVDTYALRVNISYYVIVKRITNILLCKKFKK